MENKVWFITGCSTGFGKILAQELLKTPAKVVATARNTASLADLKGINDANLLALPLDVTSSQQINDAIAKANAHFGSIDVLVNNAGYGMLGALEEASMEAIRRMFETNVFGLVAVTKAVLPQMRKARAGHIINMSSIAGLTPTAGFSSYNGTKYAVEGFSEALALEVAPLGIHVTVVEPGPFRTDFASRSLDVMPEITDYRESVGKTRGYIEQINGTQPGDPLKAAHIMIDIARQPKPPLHLLLGSMAADRLKVKLQSWNQDMLTWEPLARSADF